jgi:putative ABC transport system permease protein
VKLPVRWRKSVRDLGKRPGRSLLTVLALAAGVFEVALVLDAYGLLQPELRDVHGRTVPASATLHTDRVDDALVDSLRALPGIAKVEARPVLVARARASASQEWLPAQLHVVRDFDAQQLDLFASDTGAWPPGPGDVLLERTALQVAGVEVGDSLTVRLENGRAVRLRVAGTAHAPGMAPAWMEHMVPGFIGWSSVLRGDGSGESPQFRFVATHALDEGDIRERSEEARALLVRNGVDVSRVQVPTPGKHPHADQMAAFRFLLLAFGVLSLILSAVLVASMVHAFMAEQVREVGILKAIGATSRQVAGIYLAQVTVLAALGIVLGLPPGLWAGHQYANFSAGILNTDVSHSPFPWWVVGVVVGVGILLPLAVSLGPVRRAAAITVREALADEAPPLARLRGIDAWLRRWTWIPRPLALSFRTALARRARLVLAVTLLATGGAAFMAALNVAEAWTRAVDGDFRRRRYDLTLVLSEFVPVAAAERVVHGVAGVADTEHWPTVSPFLADAQGVATTSASLVGIEPATPLLEPRIVAGRWLRKGDTDAVVVNQAVSLRGRRFTPGDSLRFRIRGATHAFRVVGVARELAPMPTVYATRAHVLGVTGRSPDSTRAVRIVLDRHGVADQRAAAAALERACEAAGLPVSHLQRMEDARQAILDHLVIIFSILTLAASVVVFVGALGLTSTLTLSVLQRTRELGVLGALGATPRTLATHVWLEGMALALLSWLGAALLTFPLSWALGAACGAIFLKAPLDPWLSPRALATWLGLVLVLATLSSFHPALRAARLHVRDALGHV